MHTRHSSSLTLSAPDTSGGMIWGVATCSAVVALGIVDYLTGYELSFSLFYLAPISAAGWFVGRRLGLTISAASAVTWLIADVAAGNTYTRSLFLLWNTLIRFGFFVIVTLLLARLRVAYQREQELARTDRTTGAANSRHFHELAQFELDHARRLGYPLTIAYIDLDNFKAVNDRFGHAQGDEVLRAVGSCVQKHLRVTDVVARLGGDEFALLLPGADRDGAQAVISKIQGMLATEMRTRHWPVTFSIGIVTFTAPPPSVDAMIHSADELMYTVKTDHKNGARYETREG